MPASIIGIHCYNHYRWQDYVQTLPLAEVRGEFEAARAEFLRISGTPGANGRGAGLAEAMRTAVRPTTRAGCS